MRILHCADIHLDSQMNTNLDRTKAKERKLEILDTFISMIDYAADNKVDAVIIAGDLFDTNAFSTGTRNSVIGAINSHPNINFYYIKGNHGGGNRFIETLKDVPENLHFFEESLKTYELFERSGNKITLSGIELTPDNMNAFYSSLLLNPNDFNIVTLHGQINTHTDNRYSDSINLTDIHGKNVDYLALGHYHEYQEGDLHPRGKYCYCGCLEGRGFDECGEHGFVLLDINEDNFSYSLNFVDFAKRHLYEIPVNISDCKTNADVKRKIDEATKSFRPSFKDFIKIILVGDIEVDCEKNIDYLAKQLNEVFYFAKVTDQTRIAVDYNIYEKEASLKGEFVRLIKSDSSLSGEEKAEIIRCGIQALNGEDIEI